MKRTLAPIALFCFNRPNHLKKTVRSLQKNFLCNKSSLYIFSDGAHTEKDNQSVNQVRDFISKIKGFQNIKIILRRKNFGLAKNIISGINLILKRYSKVIVLEDDLISNKYFLRYMNENLEYYKKNSEVASIHGYVYPLEKKNLKNNFFIKGADCWGWGTWRRAWKYYENNPKKLISELKKKKLIREFNFNNKKDYFRMLLKNLHSENKSWAVQWYASAFIKNMYTLYPKYTLIKNIGVDGSGKNTFLKYNVNSNFTKRYIVNKYKKVEENKLARLKFENYFEKTEKNIVEKIYFKIFDE